MSGSTVLTTPKFWSLLVESGLADEARCRQWQVEYRRAAIGAEADTPTAIAAWLIERKYLTKYQARTLLEGTAGPFVYGPYVISERTKQAPFPHCYGAFHSQTNYAVWLQFLGADILSAPEKLVAVESRVVPLCSLDHPSLHRWFEYQVIGSYRFLVMEPLEGGPLSAALAKGRLNLHRACWIGQQLAEALAALHSAGLVHGHVRLDQVWINQRGRASLLLHGFVPELAGSAPEEHVRADFWAPEYLQPGYQPSALADAYALGCLLYALLAGQPPFPGGTVAEKLHRHATEPIRPLEKMGVPAELARLVTYLLAKNPALRSSDLREVARRLGEFSEGEADRMAPAGEHPGRAAYLAYLAQRQPGSAAGPFGGTAPAIGSPLATAVPPPGTVPRAMTVVATQAGPTGGIAVVTPAAPPAWPVATSGGQACPASAGVVPSASPWSVGAGPPIAPQSFVAAAPVGYPVAAWPVGGAPGGGAVGGASGGGAVPVAVAPAPQVVAPAAVPAVAVAPVMGPSIQVRATRGRRRSRAWPAWLAVISMVALSVGVVYFGRDYLGQIGGGQKAPQSHGDSDVPPGQDASSKTSATGSGAEAEQQGSGQSSSTGSVVPSPGMPLIEEDGQSLWASPTQGEPWSLALVPPEPLLIVALRPAQIMASPEAQKIIKALGPEIEKLIAQWPAQAAGWSWSEIDQLIISLHGSDSATLRPAFVIGLSSPIAPPELLQRWGMPSPKAAADSKTFYQSETWAYYFRPDENPITRFAMGSPENIQDVAQLDGAPPAFYTGMEPLLAHSDSSRMATVFFVPHHLRTKLLADGTVYYFGDGKKLQAAIDSFLASYVKVGALSVHVTDSFSYMELTATTEASQDKYEALRILKANIAKWPLESEQYIAQLPHHPYWSRFSLRFPSMLTFVKDHVRGQVDKNILVLNAVLPPTALHNLAFGAEMLLVNNPGMMPVAAGPAAPPEPAGPKTIEEVLQQKISIRFDQTSLEFAMRDVASQVRDAYPTLPFEFDIVLLGMDMQKDGITKNQSIRDFNQQDVTVAEVLTALVMRGNPDTTVKSPNQPNQKLVWCVGDDPNKAGRRVVLITTRDGAAARGIQLPSVFTQ